MVYIIQVTKGKEVYYEILKGDSIKIDIGTEVNLKTLAEINLKLLSEMIFRDPSEEASKREKVKTGRYTPEDLIDSIKVSLDYYAEEIEGEQKYLRDLKKNKKELEKIEALIKGD